MGCWLDARRWARCCGGVMADYKGHLRNFVDTVPKQANMDLKYLLRDRASAF